MKYTITINQEKLHQMAPEANLTDGAILDFLHWFCASVSPAIEQSRVVASDGTRYTWIDYEYAIGEMPLLKSASRATMTRAVARLEKFGFIKTCSPDHRRKYVAPTAKMDHLFHRSGDKPVGKLLKRSKLYPKRNSTVSQMKQSQGGSCFSNETYQSIKDPDINDPSRNRFSSGPESIKSILGRRPKTKI